MPTYQGPSGEHLITMLARQNPQLIALLIFIETYCANIVFVALKKHNKFYLKGSLYQ